MILWERDYFQGVSMHIRKTITTFVLVMLFLSFGGVFAEEEFRFYIFQTFHWESSPKSEYPEVVINCKPNQIRVEPWESDSFDGNGELSRKWSNEIPFEYELEFHNFNNTPQGWLFITTTQKPEEEITLYMGNITKID